MNLSNKASAREGLAPSGTEHLHTDPDGGRARTGGCSATSDRNAPSGFGVPASVVLISACALALQSSPTAAQQSTETYVYDALGRLIKVEVAGGQNEDEVHSLCYDPAGNRTAYEARSDGQSAACVTAGEPGSGGGTPPPPPPPSFSAANAGSVIEGGVLVFTVAKSGGTSTSFSVNYAAAGGTATAGSDFVATSGTLTFAANESAKQVSVTTIDDALSEMSETVVVTLSGATGGATIGIGQGSGTISDNDGLMTLTDQYLAVLPAHQSTYACEVYDIPELGLFQEVCNLTANGVIVYNSNSMPPEDPGYYRPPPGTGTPLQVQSGYYGTGVTP